MTEDQNQPIVSANGQLIKGLSFIREDIIIENNPTNIQPKIDITLNLANKILNTDTYEVVIEITAKATHNEREYFSIELDYAGIFTIKNVNNEQKEQILNIHCPTLLFPFARRVLADTTREAGFMPLMLDPIDFVNIFNQKKIQQNSPLDTQNTLAN